MKLPQSKEFWSGMTFIAFGAVAIIVGLQYRMGVVSRMGPGYFPVMLGCILCVLGGTISAKALAVDGEPFRLGPVRPFLILVGVVVFALLLRPAGLVIATAALVLVGTAAGHQFSLAETVAIGAVMITLSVGIFVFGIGLPIPIWPR